MAASVSAALSGGASAKLQGELRAGETAMRAGELAQAERHYRTALAHDPDNVVALRQLAVIALRVRHYNTAFRLAARALQLAGNDARTCNVVGGVLFELGSYEAAAAAFREALRLDPDLDDAVENYALVLQTQGRRADAAELLAGLVEKHPDSARLWQLYATSRHFPAGATELRQLRKLLARRGQSAGARAQLQFALAKMLEDAGDAVGAYRACEAGNRLRLELERDGARKYRDGSFRRHAAGLIDVFRPELVERLHRTVEPRRGLTLLLGPPRAGKTLLEGPLAAHPAVRAYGEIDVVYETLRKGGEDFARAYPQSMRSIGEADFASLAARLDAAWGEPPGDGIVTHVLTTPSNGFHAATIALLNPATRLVICERDAVDVAMAIWFKFFAKSQPYAWDVDTVAEYVAVYERITDHWRRVFPERCMTVTYDELVAEPDRTVSAVLGHHALDWHPDCADEHGAELPAGAVGLSGSGAARSRVSAEFGRLSQFYAANRAAFADAVKRARGRVASDLR